MTGLLGGGVQIVTRFDIIVAKITMLMNFRVHWHI